MELPAQLLYLPEEYRGRLETLRDALQWAHELSGEHPESECFHYASSDYISLCVMHDVRSLVAALLTNSSKIPQESIFYMEIEAALADYYHSMEQDYPQISGERSEAEEHFLSNHPDLKKRIDRRVQSHE